MGRLATGIGPPILTHPLGLHPGLGTFRHRPFRHATKVTAINTRAAWA
jgi:hypothetical protein